MNTIPGGDIFADWSEMSKLLVRFVLDLAFASVVIRLIYYRLYRNREYVFTYYLFNVVTLFLCLLLRKVPTELGFALALFGVFGILRYRTEQIRIRDLTYLFIVIGLGLLNGVANGSVSMMEILVVNGVVVGMVAAIELRPWKDSLQSTPMIYDHLELLQPGNEAKLLADIHLKTGMAALRVEVQRIDLLRDAADILVFHPVSPSR
ncbi:MAG: DUF4956 domain-containing protein [Candidatus Eisenbacteria bacterium]|nr:DUF4956 domain-containing protein [Candidatus Eisenbacteria bacterium]